MEFTWKVVLMAVLLGGSAFFSGSETAFFNLTRRQINQFRKSKHKLHKLVCELLDDPKKLLSSLLFGNMVVNVLFFATASVLIVKIERQVGPTAATITAFVSFGCLVLFGEIIPKSLSYGSSTAISVAAAVPAFLCIKIFSPLIFFFRFFLVEPILRLILGPGKPPKPISANEFKAFISQVKNRGLISPYENILLSEIIEFGFLKVRDCMQPRVDMVSCTIAEAREKACDLMLKNQLTKLPVYSGEIDNIVGMIYLRDLLLKAELSIGKLIKPAHFIPEQKTLESLLEFFRNSQTDTAVVVDEYGGIAGMIRLEDIAEELVGPIGAETEAELMEQIGPMAYRLAGSLPIHDWNEAFGIADNQTQLTTISGFVTALLGKIPKKGDVANLNNLKFTVEQVKKHRIETLILTFEQGDNSDQ